MVYAERAMGRLPIGEIIDTRFRIVRALGQGGMGTVYEAEHLGLDRRVAIKVLHEDVEADDGALARFRQEARAIAQVESPYVCRALDTGKIQDGASYMVLELLDGRSLADALRAEGPMAPPRAVDIVLQVCHAVADAHRRGIVHRDLKPANIFLTVDADGEPMAKVLDFGVSKVTKAGVETTASAILGTPLYMAPEQLTSSATVDGRVDVWSLGVCLFEMLHGAPPWRDDDLLRLATTILTEPVPSLAALRPELPPALTAVVESCLVKSLDDRCPSIEALAARLAPHAGPAGARVAERIAARREPAPDPAAGSASMPSASSLGGAVRPAEGSSGRPPGRLLLVGTLAIGAAIVALTLHAGPRRPETAAHDVLRLPGPAAAVAFSPAGKLLAAATREGDAMRLRTFDLATREMLREALVPAAAPGHFSSDGEWLTATATDGAALVVGVAAGVVAHRFQTRDALVVAPTDRGDTVLVGHADRNVRRWRVGDASPTPLATTEGTPHFIGLDARGARAVVGDSRGVVLAIDLEHGRETCRARAGEAAIASTAMAPDGALFAAGDNAGTLWVFETTTCRVLASERTAAAIAGLAYAPRGGRLVAAVGHGLEVRDHLAAKPVRHAHDATTTSVAVSPDGTRAAAGAVDGTLRVFSF